MWKYLDGAKSVQKLYFTWFIDMGKQRQQTICGSNNYVVLVFSSREDITSPIVSIARRSIVFDLVLNRQLDLKPTRNRYVN